MSDIVEGLRFGICDDPCRVRDIPSGCACAQAADRIERLEKALREIAKHSRGGVIDTTEKMDRDEFIGIARAALEGK